jgi:hypothetical protein
LPVPSAIACCASRSASVFSSRGTWNTRHAAKRRIRDRAAS